MADKGSHHQDSAAAEGYRDIEQSEWEEKHREWQVLSENKIKFQQQYDVMHQQMLGGGRVGSEVDSHMAFAQFWHRADPLCKA